MFKNGCQQWKIKKEVDEASKSGILDDYFKDKFTNEFAGVKVPTIIEYTKLSTKPNEKFIQGIG